MNIFELFNEQLAELTPLRVGDTVYYNAYGNGAVYKAKVNSIGFDPLTNSVTINGRAQEYFIRESDAKKELLIRSVKKTKEDIRVCQNEINSYKERLAKAKKKLKELKSK